MKRILIYGAGGHAKVIFDILRAMGGWQVGAFLDDGARKGATFLGLPVLPRGALEELKRAGFLWGFVAVGDNRKRLELGEHLKRSGLRLAKAVHPRSTLAPGVAVGEGSCLMAGAVVNSGSRLGPNVIINTGATVDHDCILGAGVHISPGANLAGGVRVGKGAQLGVGSCAAPGVRIGAWALVGAGAAVVKDVSAGVLAMGVPARVVKRLK